MKNITDTIQGGGRKTFSFLLAALAMFAASSVYAGEDPYWQPKAGGWDGTYQGHPVKDGTYFVLVKARGADGVEYDIRRDVNLLRDHNNLEDTTTNP